MRRRKSVRLPKSVVLAAVLALAVSYVPLTGLDHLHLHIERGLHFFHDHLHIGHHEHGHAHHAKLPEDGDDRDHPDEQDLTAAVVTLGHAAQVQPHAVEISAGDTPVAPLTTQLPGMVDDKPPHPSWQSRAPPV